MIILVPADAGQVVNKPMIRLTLPAAIIVSFSKIERMDSKMALLAFVGLMASVIMMTDGALVTRGKDKKTQALYMLCFPAVNIGSFAIPFTQSFLPEIGSMVLVAFAPMSAIAPAYVGWCGGDEGMASCANSMSVLISVVEILCLVVLLGLY